MPKTPFSEYLIQNNKTKQTFSFTDASGKPSFKSLEVFKREKKVVCYPFTPNIKLNQITSKKIQSIEFKGWEKVEDLPNDFKKTPGYGFSSFRSKQFFSMFQRKLPKVRDIIIALNSPSKINANKVTFNWSELLEAFRMISKEKDLFDTNRKTISINFLSEFTNVRPVRRKLNSGELEYFLGKYDSFEKISSADINSLTEVLSDLPVSKITATNHIIEAREKIDRIYLEDIIEEFDNLMKSSSNKEEPWQQFFSKNTWVLNHLFPYDVLLNKGKAYVGGKTFENDEGRIVDFLFQTGFKDNFALLEIKTPAQDLLKKSAYRKPAVYAASEDLSGGVNQCLDQKDQFLRDSGQKVKSFDPKCVLVIGQKDKLSETQKECFELFRSNQKNVDVVAFDELKAKLSGLHQVITGKFNAKQLKKID